jgi:hypothetical protein
MSDMTNEPTAKGPDDVTPVEPSVAPTEPMPAAEYVAPTAEAEPVYAAPAAEPAYAAVPPAAPVGAPASSSGHVSISKKWLLIVGGAILAVILLGGTFAAGATVGRHGGGRFDGRGPTAFDQSQRGGMQPGGQRQFRGDGDYHQRGGRGMKGWRQGEQGTQQQGVPNTQQAPSTVPTP